MTHIDSRRVYRIESHGNVHALNGDFECKSDAACIVYWMSRDQRVQDNWALLAAQEQAILRKLPLIVAFTLVPEFLEATIRSYHFMLQGLEEVSRELAELHIPFHLIETQNPSEGICEFAQAVNAGIVFTDFDPLRIKITWKVNAAKTLQCPLYEVDAHNVIPARYVSQKVEFGAYTLRPKIKKLLPEFLTDFPLVIKNIFPAEEFPQLIKANDIEKRLTVRTDVAVVKTFLPGTMNGLSNLKSFIDNKLDAYHEKRNDPNAHAISDMSPWFHFGNVAPQRAALHVKSSGLNPESIASYLEELIVRRELADNYCLYNPNYDNFNGFHSWAQTSLHAHRDDKRDYLYTSDQFEHTKTHDELWNAAQREVMQTGKMHGYMRMYWAKKILEWTSTPEEAQTIAIYLNDTYQLDGRDPNGYTGIAWSIGGVHDRAWFERPVYGKIRYMNANGCKSKFDVAKYCKQYASSNAGSSLFD